MVGKPPLVVKAKGAAAERRVMFCHRIMLFANFTPAYETCAGARPANDSIVRYALAGHGRVLPRWCAHCNLKHLNLIAL